MVFFWQIIKYHFNVRIFKAFYLVSQQICINFHHMWINGGRQTFFSNANVNICPLLNGF